MDSKKSNRLFKKFKFLKKREMPAGFECDEGWYDIIHDMCLKLRDLDMSGDFVITKIANRHGNMEVHSKKGNNSSRLIIQNACELSEDICDGCGNDKDLEQCSKCTVVEEDYPDEYKCEECGAKQMLVLADTDPLPQCCGQDMVMIDPFEY